MRKNIIITIVLFLLQLNISAKKVDGYIINNSGKKIHGQIRLTSVFYPSGAVSINNINYVPLYVSVFFKENGAKRFKEYFANDIEGFSFSYDNQQIYFFSIGITVNEWGRAKLKKQFLRLLQTGHLILFDLKSLVKLGYDYTEFTDYYISDSKNNLYNVSDHPYSSLEDFLVKKIKIDKEFLKAQPFPIHLRNIKEIVKSYNNWISNQQNNIRVYEVD